MMIASGLDGVLSLSLDPKGDDRGELVEVFRSRWAPGFQPVQWNTVRSEADVLRGVHCHIDHTDYLVILEGSMLLGLHDLRPGSPTEGRSDLVRLRAGEASVLIPPGVAHGFSFDEPTRLLYAVSHEWNVADELACRFDDPELRIDWPSLSPRLSPRDESAGSLSEMRDVVRAAFAGVGV